MVRARAHSAEWLARSSFLHSRRRWRRSLLRATGQGARPEPAVLCFSVSSDCRSRSSRPYRRKDGRALHQGDARLLSAGPLSAGRGLVWRLCVIRNGAAAPGAGRDSRRGHHVRRARSRQRPEFWHGHQARQVLAQHSRRRGALSQQEDWGEKRILLVQIHGTRGASRGRKSLQDDRAAAFAGIALPLDLRRDIGTRFRATPSSLSLGKSRWCALRIKDRKCSAVAKISRWAGAVSPRAASRSSTCRPSTCSCSSSLM